MSKGSVYVVIEDAIDAALIHSESTVRLLEQMEEDADNDVGVTNDFEDAAEMIDFDDGDNDFFKCKDEDGNSICSGDYEDDDLPIYSMDPADMQAAEYLNAYHDIKNGVDMTIGDMIDIIADTQ